MYRVKLKIYLATSWKNAFYEDVLIRLRKLGYEVYDFKENGFSWDKVEVTGTGVLQYVEGLRNPIAKKSFKMDMEALEECDVCIQLQPCGSSACLELGYAVGAKKHTAILLMGIREPELMLDMADHIILKMEVLEAWLDCIDTIVREKE